MVCSLLVYKRYSGAGDSPADAISSDWGVRTVIDGDTIELENGERVRYIGINAPEIMRREDTSWVYDPHPFGEDAKEFNRRLVEGKRVRLEYDQEVRDRYGRLLAYVYVEDVFVNAEMVKAGLAETFVKLPNTRHAALLTHVKEEAQDRRRGIWDAHPPQGK